MTGLLQNNRVMEEDTWQTAACRGICVHLYTHVSNSPHIQHTHTHWIFMKTELSVVFQAWNSCLWRLRYGRLGTLSLKSIWATTNKKQPQNNYLRKQTRKKREEGVNGKRQDGIIKRKRKRSPGLGPDASLCLTSCNIENSSGLWGWH